MSYMCSSDPETQQACQNILLCNVVYIRHSKARGLHTARLYLLQLCSPDLDLSAQQTSPMSISYSHLFQQEKFSDVTLVIKVTGAEGSPDGRVLRRLPAHRALLSASPVLASKLERWPEPSRPSKRPKLDPDADNQDASQEQQQPAQDQESSGLPEAAITLDSEEQQDAAMAVIAAMYGVSTATEQLSDVQLLHMAVLADMLQVQVIADKAVNALNTAAADPARGLSDEAKQHMCSMQAWPACFAPALDRLTQQLPLQDAASIWARVVAPKGPSSSLADVQAAPHSKHMQERLLQELGDLEAVWEDAAKQQLLLGLPLPAIQLLLSSSQLQVVSEDTVLYTAQKYVDSQRGDEQQQAARQQLAPLVRCPYLSPFWLTAAARCTESELLLAPMRDQLLQLLQLLQVVPDFGNDAAVRFWFFQKFKWWAPNPPDSWLLGKRQPKAQLPCAVTWLLPVSELKQLCETAAASKSSARCVSPGVTPPLRGCAYSINLVAQFERGGVKVGVCALLHNSGKLLTKCSATFMGGAVIKSFKNQLIAGNNSWGFGDFFEIGPMAGGWDEAAWSAKGLPTQGNIVFKVSVS